MLFTWLRSAHLSRPLALALPPYDAHLVVKHPPRSPSRPRAFSLLPFVHGEVHAVGRRYGDRPATCHAPTGRTATCHALTDRRATCHTPYWPPHHLSRPHWPPRHLSRPHWPPRYLSRPHWPPHHLSRPHWPPRHLSRPHWLPRYFRSLTVKCMPLAGAMGIASQEGH